MDWDLNLSCLTPVSLPLAAALHRFLVRQGTCCGLGLREALWGKATHDVRFKEPRTWRGRGKSISVRRNSMCKAIWQEPQLRKRLKVTVMGEQGGGGNEAGGSGRATHWVCGPVKGRVEGVF